MKEKIEKEDKLEDHYPLTELYKSKEMTGGALEVALEILKKDKNWEDRKLNKLILNKFKELGNVSPITQKYRKLFQRLLN